MPNEKLFATKDGLFLCETHASETGLAVDEVTDEEFRELVAARCGMCGQLPSPGRTCQRCDKPLHELWPAVYCTNECAYEDA